MEIRMLKSIKGSDGVVTKNYKEGHIYKVPSEISSYLSEAWLQKGICEINKIRLETKIETEFETKEKYDLNSAPYRVLQKLAKKNNIENYSRKSKKKLIEELREVL